MLLFTTLKPAKNNKLRILRSLCETHSILYYVFKNLVSKILISRFQKVLLQMILLRMDASHQFFHLHQ